MRDSDFSVKDQVLKEFLEFTKSLQEKRQVQIQVQMLNHDVPQDCDPDMIDIIQKACEERQIPFHKMVSGAYHDAMLVSRFAPIGMIFVPSKEGISHSPAEWTDTIDIVKGVNILTDTLYNLAAK